MVPDLRLEVDGVVPDLHLEVDDRKDINSTVDSIVSSLLVDVNTDAESNR